MKSKNIFLLKYKTNQSDDFKFKAFETEAMATEYHLNFRENVTKLGYPNREIIHYEILLIPFNLDISQLGTDNQKEEMYPKEYLNK